MKGILLLFRFMTRLPIGFEPKFDSDELGKSMKFFPIIGMIIGLILFGAFWLLYTEKTPYTSTLSPVLTLAV